MEEPRSLTEGTRSTLGTLSTLSLQHRAFPKALLVLGTSMKGPLLCETVCHLSPLLKQPPHLASILELCV